MSIHEIPDEPYDTWAQQQAEEQWAEYQRWLEAERSHRCPPDMPPCPLCQDREAIESNLFES